MKTEQDIIDGNIVLHNYFTGKEWKMSLNFDLSKCKDGKVWMGTNINGRSIENAETDYHLPSGFYSLWQVLQKIEEFVKVHKIDDTRYSDYPTLSQKYWELEMLVSKKSDPVDIFWAAVELIKEYNKYLKK